MFEILNAGWVSVFILTGLLDSIMVTSSIKLLFALVSMNYLFSLALLAINVLLDCD